jgi:hypothetical protein
MVYVLEEFIADEIMIIAHKTPQTIEVIVFVFFDGLLKYLKNRGIPTGGKNMNIRIIASGFL